LVNHQHNLFGLTGNRARSISVTYGWTFVVLGILIAIGVFINVLVSVLFIVIATIATTMVAMAISRQLFK
jgi:multisubunit Na+/H+ antiporter MnhG subunit